MSYLVLARKWRPQVFEDVIGQRAITQTLQNAISQERVAHAFLFTGARGVGKTSTARILAKALNCEKGPAINPCNQCQTCREVSSGISIDVIEIDGASNRGIDEIRELRENVRYAPAKSRYKIFIIDEVHMLTREAFNALLKTLEEPPTHIVFIFATTEPHKIPATILSRCQRYDFKRIALKEIGDALRRISEEEHVVISESGLVSIARESEGSMRDAQSLLDQVISYSGKEIRDEDILEVLGLVDQKILNDTLEAIINRDAARCVEIVERIYQYGYDPQQFCRELLQSLRNLILIKVSQDPKRLIQVPEEELKTLVNLADRLSLDHLNHLFNLLLRGEEEVGQSTFPRTMLEMALIRMATLRPVLPIDDVLKRLENLERKTGPGRPPAARKTPAPGKRKELEEQLPPKTSKESDKADLSTEIQGLVPESKDIPGETSPQASEEAWKDLLNFARARNPVLGSFLAFGDLVRLSDEIIEIGFERDSFHYERMLEAENRLQLEKICRDYLSKETRVVISQIGERLRSRGRVGPARVGPAHAGPEIMEPARNVPGSAPGKKEENPLVQATLRLFNGSIVEG